MTNLASFSKQELELLVSLPYKAGVYVSNADDIDGAADDKHEQKALESCLKAIAKLHQGKPFIADIIKQTLALRSEWTRWGEQDFHAPANAETAMSLLRAKIGEEDLKSYRAVILEIASAVAQAYGEFGAFDEGSDAGAFGILMNKIVGGFSSHEDADHPMNVSPAEDSALSRLAAAMKI